MSDPTPAATYRLFSWLRQGLLAGDDEGAQAGTGTRVSVRKCSTFLEFLVAVAPLLSYRGTCTAERAHRRAIPSRLSSASALGAPSAALSAFGGWRCP